MVRGVAREREEAAMSIKCKVIDKWCKTTGDVCDAADKLEEDGHQIICIETIETGHGGPAAHYKIWYREAPVEIIND